VSSTVTLILSYVLTGWPAAVISVVVLLLFALLWFALPLSGRR
jgi:hypothetical protein